MREDGEEPRYYTDPRNVRRTRDPARMHLTFSQVCSSNISQLKKLYVLILLCGSFSLVGQ